MAIVPGQTQLDANALPKIVTHSVDQMSAPLGPVLPLEHNAYGMQPTIVATVLQMEVALLSLTLTCASQLIAPLLDSSAGGSQPRSHVLA